MSLEGGPGAAPSADDSFYRFVLGERAAVLAVAFGIDSYWNAEGKYRHRRFEQRFYKWPTERDKLRRDVEATSGKRVDVYACPALRYTRNRRKGSALPLGELWADLDSPTDNEFLTELNPFIVESGSEGHRHVYVPLTEPVDLETWQQLQLSLRHRLGGDAKIADNDLLRLPGTWNHKTDPPSKVQSLPWTGSAWDPDDLAALLKVHLDTPAKPPPARLAAEQPPNPLPPAVLDALADRHVDDVDDRSMRHHRLVWACREAGLTIGQTLAVVSGYLPSRAKYGDRLPQEVSRSWNKFVPPPAEQAGPDQEDTDGAARSHDAGPVAADVIDGAALLDEVATFIRRFVVFPSDAALTAVTLWAAHTHVIGLFESTPRLALLSPEPGSGKSRTLEVLELLTPHPMWVLNVSPAALFRSIRVQRPTLLLDEVDTIFTRKGKNDEHADLRALLNAGHRDGNTIPRCVGPRHDVEQFPTYCAVALAGLGDLPETIMTRAVVIRMRKRAPDESVEPFRWRLHRENGKILQKSLTEWAKKIRPYVSCAYPELPPGITDRPADVWEPLLAIAEAAGGDWPKHAREACVALVRAAQTDAGSLGVRLLADLRTVFTIFDDTDPENAKPTGRYSRMSTETILRKLRAMPEAPWADLRGSPLDSRGLARRLGDYGVKSKKIRIRETVCRGYTAEDLHDPWRRYLSPTPAEEEHPEHEEHRRSEP